MNNIGLSGGTTLTTSILLVLLSALFLEVAVGQNGIIINNEATLAVTTIGPSSELGVGGGDVVDDAGVQQVDTTMVPTMFPTTLFPTTLSPTTRIPTFFPTFSPTETLTIMSTSMNPTQQATTDSPTAAATTGTPTEESMPPTTSNIPTVPIPAFPADEVAITQMYNCSSTESDTSHDEETCNQYKDMMISGHKDDECVCYYFCSDTGTPESSGGYVQCLERDEVKEFGCSGGASVISCLDKTKLEELIETSDATPTIDSIKEALDSLYYTAAVALGAIICAF